MDEPIPFLDWASLALAHYRMRKPAVRFIRHSDNLTFQVTDGRKKYVLRIHKPRIRPDELEFPARQLIAPVTGKILNHPRFPRHDPAKIESDPAGFKSPRCAVLGQMTHFRRVKQCFARHAAAQDAQTADGGSAFDDDGFPTRAGGRARGGVTSATAPENSDLVVESSHNPRMRD